MRQCPICRRWVEKALQEDKCPHVVLSEVQNSMQSNKKAFAQRVKAAQEMVGQRVWFNPKRDRIHTVQGSDNYGMLTLDGVLGQVSAHWCIKAL
jgi:hypothetical protein